MPITQMAVRVGETSVDAYTLSNTGGLEAEILSYGGTLRALRAPGRDGRLADIVLGFDDPADYAGPHPFFGSLVGRFANRIKAGRFELDGVAYSLAVNNGPNHLHGGPAGFHRQVWEAQAIDAPDGPSLTLAYRSADGEEGYPGELLAIVTYTLTEANELRLDYEARATAPTILNLTNHAYFNLAGEGTIHGHELQLAASHYLPIDPTSIPLGELRPVAGTPFDLRRPALLGERIAADDEQLRLVQGFDHCFVFDKSPGTLALVGALVDPESGRALELFTTQPGVQVYSGNFLTGSFVGKGGTAYGQYSAVCLETQHFPDSPNQPQFPSVVLRPGERYRHTTIYRMGIR